jgi:hypothetical protein
MFLTNALFANNAEWRNRRGLVESESKQEVDELCHRWRETRAKIRPGPEDKPWQPRELESPIWTVTFLGNSRRSKRRPDGSLFQEMAPAWSARIDLPWA